MYTSLAAEDRRDYDKVKKVLLKRFSLTDEGYRKEFSFECYFIEFNRTIAIKGIDPAFS